MCDGADLLTFGVGSAIGGVTTGLFSAGGRTAVESMKDDKKAYEEEIAATKKKNEQFQQELLDREKSQEATAAAATQSAAQRQRARAARRGRGDIHTSPLGIINNPFNPGKTAIGS